jgi:4-hydroxythreonine-4-phosphate dehydrogenase
LNSAEPLLALTPGEPAGVGPEITVKLAARHPELPIVAVADPDLLRTTAETLGLTLGVHEWRPGISPVRDSLAVAPVFLNRPARPGHLDRENATYVLSTIRQAVEWIRKGELAALVTGPVHKAVINDAGIAFSGHTEYLAELGQVPQVVMMLAAPGLRVALVTTHLPLRDVSAAITGRKLEDVIRITHSSLRRQFGIPHPRLQVLGLNPHAGEGGHLGHEDDQVIRPALDRLRSEGLVLTGPVPADTAFTPPRLATCDAVVAMYHDQGLPVLKHMGFGQSVNITLGLPFIRTSVDHGTALDIAGAGKADESSLLHAIRTAQEMARHSRSHSS